MNELRNRGVEDVLLAVVDGLKGFPEAILAVFPQATVQTCIVHLLRHSLDFVSYKDRKPLASALKGIYRAVDATAGEVALAAFEDGPWGRRYPAIGQSWRRAWGEVVPFYAFPADVRRILTPRMRSTIPHPLGVIFFVEHGRPRGEEQGRRMQALPRSLIGAPPLRRPCSRIEVGAAASG